MAVDGQYRKLVMRAAGATTAQVLADCRGYGHKDLSFDHPVREIRIAKGGLRPLEAGKWIRGQPHRNIPQNMRHLTG